MEYGHSLALAFDSDSSEFVRGVEVGRLWEQLKLSDEVIQEVHSDNAEMVLRLAEATGRTVRCEELNNDWLRVSFGCREVPRGDFHRG